MEWNGFRFIRLPSLDEQVSKSNCTNHAAAVDTFIAVPFYSPSPYLRICGPSSCYPLIHLYLWSICFPLICFPLFPLIRDLPFIIGDSPSRLRLWSICFPLFRGQLFISVRKSTSIIIRNNIIQ